MSPNPRVQLKAHDLTIAYDRVVALQLSELDIEGNIISVIGNNGAGKSTLIKTILGLLPARSGTFSTYFNNQDGLRRLVPEQDMAFCPETGSVFADISVESYIKMWCRIKQRDPRYYRQGGSAIIDLLDIGPLLGRLGRELSKGQRRRVQTAIGFLMQPRLFLFDEPFDGLDVQRTDQLAQLIRNYSSKMCFIISSHRMDVVERLADQVIVLDKGGVYAAADLAQVCQRLAGDSYIIPTRGEIGAIQAKLAATFPAAIVNTLGSQITLTSPNTSIPQIKTLLGDSQITVDQVRPSLVDAVNFYLSHQKR